MTVVVVVVWLQGYAGTVDYDAEIKNIEKGGRAGQTMQAGRGGPGGRGGPQKFRDRGDGPGKGGAVNKKRLMKNAKFGGWGCLWGRG